MITITIVAVTAALITRWRYPLTFDKLISFTQLFLQFDSDNKKVESLRQSYERQISSAERRGDTESAQKLRIEYESQEQAWRSQYALRAKPFINSTDSPGKKLEQKEITQLRTLLDRSRVLSTMSKDDWFIRGNAYLLLEESTLALEAYEKSLGGNKTKKYRLPNYAIALARSGNLELALNTYETLLNMYPGEADYHTNKGNILVDLEKNNDALDSYQAALAINENHFDALYNRANLKSDLGQMEEAIFDYKKAISVAPKNPDVHNDLGNALSITGNPDQALNEYSAAINLRPDYARAHYNRGITLTRMERFEDAIKDFDRCVRLRLDIPEAHYGKGIAYSNVGDFKQALSSFERAIVLRERFPDALFAKAKTHVRLGEPIESISDLTEFLKISPANLKQIDNEPDFDELKKTSGYRNMLKKLKLS
jgi:superkiller protein 3